MRKTFLPGAVLAALCVLTFQQGMCYGADPGDTPSAPENTPEVERRTHYEEVVPREHSTIESLQYVGSIYVIILGGYLFISRDEVFHYASLQNYAANFGNMTLFDQDLPSANWGVHLITGAMAYEFYRARQYSLVDAFLMTLLQECLYQFTVETMIQPTGLENVANTTIIGTILGRGLEVSSIPMMNSDFFLVRWIGYLFNPPALLGFYQSTSTSTTRVVPVVNRSSAGVEVRLSF